MGNGPVENLVFGALSLFLEASFIFLRLGRRWTPAVFFASMLSCIADRFLTPSAVWIRAVCIGYVLVGIALLGWHAYRRRRSRPPASHRLA
jgi:hypothetical protein